MTSTTVGLGAVLQRGDQRVGRGLATGCDSLGVLVLLTLKVLDEKPSAGE
jgi:hypothetical protein